MNLLIIKNIIVYIKWMIVFYIKKIFNFNQCLFALHFLHIKGLVFIKKIIIQVHLI